jgi:aspartyl-tRNA(Asn)/glutamyl-tRNA(Gln) amidotransferase subunit C
MVNNETMLQLERQAALELSPAARTELMDQMNAVLADLEALRACPDTLPAEWSADCPLRTDEVRPSIDRSALLRNAPAADEGFFLVPRTVE